ncbi:MAG: hypothetical protein CME67_05930 [Halobacteriovoraceae bacterium]|nr:hypothetical protein [Halobacteriovoraceae bacterium]
MKKLILSSMMVAGMSLSVIAGEGAGNGGGAWVCQNNDQLKTIRWAKLVDLYEAEKEFKLGIKYYHDNYGYQDIVEVQKSWLNFVDHTFYEELTPYFEEVERNIRMVDADLEVIDDSLYRVRPPARDCLGGEVKYVQVANYTHYGSVLINEHLFKNEMFSASDKAALIFHETIYAYLRDKYGDEDSVRAREIVGYIFSKLKRPEVSERVGELIGDMPKRLGMEFVKISAGSFMMGSPKNELERYDHEQQRYVTITRDFEMMTTEVTQSMYFEVTGRNPSHFKKQIYCPNSFETRVSHTTGFYEYLCPNNPVDSVNYNDVLNFISTLNARTGKNYRLPTEAEWEFAARAGSETAYSFGEGPANLSAHAIFEGNLGDRTHEVAPIRTYSNLPNAFGLFDMHGNVWEWTQDWYEQDPTGTIDPVGPGAGSVRVIRGGSWVYSPGFLRSASRGNSRPTYGGPDMGFRLVRALH